MIFGVLACALIASCDEPLQQSSSGQFGIDQPTNRSSFFRGLRRDRQPEGEVNPGALQRGTDNFLNTEALRGQRRSQAIVVPAGNDTVELSLREASIDAAAKAVLGDTLGLSYVVADGLRGRVTLQTTGPIPKNVLLELFEAALSANGATLQKDGAVVRVVSGSSGNRTFRLSRDGIGDGASIIVAPLEFVSASEMVNLMEPLIEDGLSVLSDDRRNLLLMSGSRSSLEAGLDALNLFDVDVLQGKSVALVRLRSADPDDIVGELNTIFQSEEGGSLKGIVEFVPNARLGSVLIISSKSRYLDRARRWIRELDQSASGASAYLETYRLKSRNAVDVAPILNQLLERGSSTSSNEAEAGDGGAARTSDSDARSTVRVAADAGRNALVVRARRSEHEEIINLLRELDTPAPQVLLEATIAEVRLNEEVGVGVRWFFESGNWDFNLSDLDNGAVVGNNPGFTAVFGGGSSRVALSALASVTDVKVISSPTLMVADNTEGVLQIGDQVPIATQTTSQAIDDAIVLTQVEYRDTGIILRVKPRVGAGGRVNLEIEQEVSDVSATRTSGIDSPTISTRLVRTNAVLQDGETLALGGLIEESDNKTRTELPGLGRVPVVGGLFRTRDSDKDRTELLILIRPRVAYDRHEASNVTGHWRTKLNSADSILKSGLGPGRHTIREFLE